MPPRSAAESITVARQWLAESPCVLVSAGAGLSVPAGVNYYDTAWFKENFPAMVQKGFSFPYQLVGHPELRANTQLRWGYLVCFAGKILAQPPHAVYQRLKAYCESRDDYFVVTTNVDEKFLLNGFSPDRLYTPQGSWRFVQCLKPCKPTSVFSSQPLIEQLTREVDPKTQEIPASLVPKCPVCGFDMMANVNGGAFFSPFMFAEQRTNEQAFWERTLAGAKQGKGPVVIVEIGVGFNTPGVLRYPNEVLVEKFGPLVKLIRVNAEAKHAVVPDSADCVGLALSVVDFFDLLPPQK